MIFIKPVFFYCCVFFILWSWAIVAAEQTINDGIQAINSGHLQKAKEIFVQLASNNDNTIEKAIAYKNLGTVRFRLGESFQSEFDESEKIFIKELYKNNTEAIRRQYGYMLYQEMNCLLSACENQLTQTKIQGIESIPFRYIKNYISPVNKALTTAKSYYPQTEIADIILLEIDLAVVESRVWEACGQSDTANRTIFKALELANKALDTDKIASDTKKKLLLRKASLLLTHHSVSPNIVAETEKLLMKAQKIQSGNTELELSVLTFYAKFMLKYKDASPRDYATLEKTIKNAVGTLELLRTSNLAEMDFAAKKNYFTTRTELYEALVMLYAKQNRPYAMLKAMNQIRSRAIQDVIIKNKIENQKQLQSILAKNKGMLLAYYVGADHVWIVSFTGNKAEISQTKCSGQEISAMCWNVLQVYSDVRHPQAYLRYGPQYETMTKTFKVSHTLYSELFEKYHKDFMYNKLEHLYIIPSNVLNYLPLSTLVVEVDLNNVFKSKFIADDTIPITYLASVNSLAENNTVNRNASSLILTRGDYSYPAYYNNDSSNPDNPMAQPLNLPGTAGEGLTVAKLLKTGTNDLLQEKQASEFNLFKKTEVPRFVVHIASHAHLNQLSPLESYVVLAAGHGEDGKVKASELLSRYQGKIHADLLVLSACDTNRGEQKLLPGDDIAALSNAFLVAGAKNVIATQWPASDTSFPKIMEYYYRGLTEGDKFDISLAKALKQFLMQDQTLMRYPIFWGNIVLTGEKQ